MLGPILLLVAFTTAGSLSGGWAGTLVGAGLAVLMSLAVAAAAATWSSRIGRHLDSEDAFRLAPRPPGFGPLCDAIYRRTLTGPPDG